MSVFQMEVLPQAGRPTFSLPCRWEKNGPSFAFLQSLKNLAIDLAP